MINHVPVPIHSVTNQLQLPIAYIINVYYYHGLLDQPEGCRERLKPPSRSNMDNFKIVGLGNFPTGRGIFSSRIASLLCGKRKKDCTFLAAGLLGTVSAGGHSKGDVPHSRAGLDLFDLRLLVAINMGGRNQPPRNHLFNYTTFQMISDPIGNTRKRSHQTGNV